MKYLIRLSISLIALLLLALMIYLTPLRQSLDEISFTQTSKKKVYYQDEATLFSQELKKLTDDSKGLLTSALYDEQQHLLTITVSNEVKFLSNVRKNNLLIWLQPKLKTSFANSYFAFDKLNNPIMAKVSLVYEDMSNFADLTNLNQPLALSEN